MGKVIISGKVVAGSIIKSDDESVDNILSITIEDEEGNTETAYAPCVYGAGGGTPQSILKVLSKIKKK